MKCSNCGATINEGSIFCPQCGSKQSPAPSMSGGNWFSQAGSLDNTPPKTTVKTATETLDSGSYIKPVKGVSQTKHEAYYDSGKLREIHTADGMRVYFAPDPDPRKSKTTSENSVPEKWEREPPKKHKDTPLPTSWKKYAAVVAAIVVVLVIAAVGIGSNNTPSNNGHINAPADDGNYYSVEQARSIMSEAGYHLGTDIDTVSEDGFFRYEANLETEEFTFLTISGTIEFEAEYDAAYDKWSTRFDPEINYEWKLSGSWFAETENYDVYMDIVSYTGSKMRLVLEAQYDSTTGGKGSYNEQDQMVTLKFVDTDSRQGIGMYDVYLYCEVSGGYPVFTLRIDKDTMTIWQYSDDYKGEFVPN